MQKKPRDIESLLHWCYRDELTKRFTSSAEGIWDHIAEYGQNGGIDVGDGAAQRYPHFGLPHPDAETIEKAVGALEDAHIDWARDGEPVLGDLLAITDVRPLHARPSQPRQTTIGYRDRHRDTIGWRTQAVPAPRDFILVRSLKTAALVTMHARMGNRPDWREEPPRLVPQLDRNRPKLVGECRGRNLYSTGSHCPARWEPSPLTIAESRADYLAWWRGLRLLASTLVLTEHEVLPPVAPEYPWNCETLDGDTTIHAGGTVTHAKLPLAPQRGDIARAGPPPSRPRHGPVTIKRIVA